MSVVTPDLQGYKRKQPSPEVQRKQAESKNVKYSCLTLTVVKPGMKAQVGGACVYQYQFCI